MEKLWKRRDCVSAEVDGALVLLDLETLAYHSLNATAVAVWDLMAVPATQQAIVEQLCTRFEVSSEQCSQSVARLLETFAASNLAAAS